MIKTKFGCVFLLSLLLNCSSIPAPERTETIDRYLNRIDFSGVVLVSQRGKATVNFSSNQHGTPNFTEDDCFLVGSLSKQFTAAAILLLAEKGQLDLDDPATGYLPEYMLDDRITVRHLLTHTSGLYNFTDHWSSIRMSSVPLDELVASFVNRELEFPPGSRVRYSNSGYVLAGLIIERISGVSYYEFIERNIFEPMGMANSGHGRTDVSGTACVAGWRGGQRVNTEQLTDTYAAGGLVASGRDLEKWVVALDAGVILRPESLVEMFQADRSAPGTGFGTGRFRVVMGLGWFNYSTPYGTEFSHGGNIDGFSSAIARYPDHEIIIIVLSNEDQYDVWGLKDRLAELVLEDAN